MVRASESACGAVYLHYIDRELNEAAGNPIRSQDAVRITRLLFLFTAAELVCGLSALWENRRLGHRALADFELLFVEQQLQTVSSDVTTNEFLESRRQAYEHDFNRYPRYFTASASQTEWASPTWQKRGGTTKALVRTLREWSSTPAIAGPFKPASLAVHVPVREALNRLELQAVTYAFFRPHLGDLKESAMAEHVIRRAISEGFTLDHMRHSGGDIATGILELEYFDSLSIDFPCFDIPLLSELANITGMSEVLDPEITSTEQWHKFVEARSSFSAQIVAGATRWITDALYARERARSPRQGDDSEQFHNKHQIRRRMVASLRQAARVAQRSGPPPVSEPAEETLQRVQQRLFWLAEMLGKRDAILRGLLDEAREGLIMPTVDVVLATVNDIETDAITSRFQSAGYRGSVQLGSINTYWVYGPIGGTVVAHVRSAMGSGGQGGSALTIIDAIRELNPGAVIGVGVAFGIDADTQPIGQLLISEYLTEYEKVKVGTDASGNQYVLERGAKSEASPRLVGRFRDTHLSNIGVEVRVGEVLSGEKLIDNPEFKTKLLTRFPEAVGGEMEGAGVQAASGRENVEWLVAKAVCDYASDKSTDKVARQRIAADVSARAVLQVLEVGGMRRRK